MTRTIPRGMILVPGHTLARMEVLSRQEHDLVHALVQRSRRTTRLTSTAHGRDLLASIGLSAADQAAFQVNTYRDLDLPLL